VVAASPRQTEQYEAPHDAADIWWLPLTYEAASAATAASTSAGADPGADRQRHPHQAHRDVSNAFLRHVIAQYTNEPAEALQFPRTEHGKPYLAGGLVKFNMSHADGLVGGTYSFLLY
jgi:phosphopantetheinyl transferase